MPSKRLKPPPSRARWARPVAAARGAKYGNVKVEFDGRRFDSKREAQRYFELSTLVKIGEVSELECQPRFALAINGVKLGTYVADFRYRRGGAVVIEDVKSKPTMTAIYRLKKKLMKALHGIEVVEVLT